MKIKTSDKIDKNNNQVLENATTLLQRARCLMDSVQNRNSLRSANEVMFKKGKNRRHPRTRTNGAFGGQSKFNKRLKAQRNN